MNGNVCVGDTVSPNQKWGTAIKMIDPAMGTATVSPNQKWGTAIPVLKYFATFELYHPLKNRVQLSFPGGVFAP
ncbi:MAG: hypothetical protein MJZ34_15430 [Paludibacteraceae bacterium]|nr:hypothetical protein [Paludibacteraceae bacterium]